MSSIESNAIPKKMKALIIYPGSESKYEEVDVPQLEDNDVLVKVHYFSQNPTDWKHAEKVGSPGSIAGCDFSGIVVKLGPKVVNANIKVGDPVAGMVHGGKFPDKGSCAEYLRVQSDLCFKVPESSLGLRETAQYGVAFATAAQVIYLHQGIAFPPAKIDVSKWVNSKWYLVYGGSSSVGLFIIQLAKLAGFNVVATASPKNFDLVKSYGADEAVDYRDPNASKRIQEITGDSLSIGLDTISEGDSFKISIDSFGSKASHKKLNSLLKAPKDVQQLAEERGVELEMTLAYLLMGVAFDFVPGVSFPAMPEEREFYVKLNQVTPELIEKYGVKPNPIHDFGGFEDILKGFQYMKEGKVSGSKLIYKFA